MPTTHTTDAEASVAQSLMDRVDWSTPELQSVGRAADRHAALLTQLASRRRGYRFEYDRPDELLAFLRKHYAAWRDFDRAPADRLVAMPVEDRVRERDTWPGCDPAMLGKAWLATGDPRYGETFSRFFDEPESANVYASQQCVRELPGWFLLLNCPGFDSRGRTNFLMHMHLAAERAWREIRPVQRQLSLGPEGHNLFLHIVNLHPQLGAIFPEFTTSSQWLRIGGSVIHEHLRGHYRPDGGARETCPGYQCGSVLEMWDYYLIAERNGRSPGHDFAEGVLRATRFLLDLGTPDGAVPRFGDSGGASLEHLAAVAAAVTGDRACKWYAQQWRTHRARKQVICESAFWMVGLGGAEVYRRTAARNPHVASVLMPDTGYAAMRAPADVATPPRYLAVAAAPRGPIVTSHGHNDIFSFDLHADGTRFLGSPGHVAYGKSDARRYDQKTQAHNCLTVDDDEQVPLLTEWRWRGAAWPTVRRWKTTAEFDFFHAVHEGYYQYGTRQVLHARKFVFVKDPGYWVMLDWLESDAEHDYRVYFHACSGGRLDAGGMMLGPDDGHRLAILPATHAPMPIEEVHSPELDAYRAAKGLTASSYAVFAARRRAADDCMAWVLFPLSPGQQRPTVRALDAKLEGAPAPAHDMTAVEVAFNGITDRIAVCHLDYDAAMSFGDESASGIMAWHRRRDDAAAWATALRAADGVCGR